MFQPADYIAGASAVIAICALGTSLWQGYVARAHARLSVRPHVEVHFHVRQEGRLSIEAVNTGIGPAFITSLVIAVGSEHVEIRGAESCRRLGRLLCGDLDQYRLEFFVPDEHSALGAGQRILLFEVQPATGELGPWMSGAESALARLNSLSANCHYKSMYGEARTYRTTHSAA